MKKSICTIMVLFIAIVSLTGCGGGSIKLAPNAETQFATAKKQFDKESWLKAIEGFQQVIFNFPGATVVDTAQYYLAMSYYGNDEFELSAVEFNRLISSYPQSAYADEAAFMVATSYLKNSPDNYSLDQEDLKRALTKMEDFIIDNPDSPLVEEARTAIENGVSKLARKDYENAILYYKMYDYRAAEIYFQYVIDNYTSTEYAPLALFKLSELSFKLKKYDEAITRFNNFRSIYPDHELSTDVDEYIAEITLQMESEHAKEES